MVPTPDSALRELVARFDPTIPVERASTPPSAWYTDPAVFELERRAVLGRAWQPVARLAELAGPGAYQSGCIVGEPWLLLRGDDDALRAFSNTCRHKGREVLQGAGTAEALVCGYHAWTYDLRGRLRSAPRMAGIQGFDRTALSLPTLPVEAWGPWAWINASTDAAPLRPRVAALDGLLTAREWERLRFHSRTSWTLACNWKVYVDNYLDGGYHVPHMHPSLDAQIDMSTYRTELHGEFSVQTVASAAAGPSARTQVDPGERIGPGAIYAWIYPNVMLNRYGPCLDSNHVIPLGPERCRVDYEFYFVDDGQGSEAARRFVESSIEQAVITQREDESICESVQVGLRSRHYDTGRYAPRVEHGEHHFHRLLATDLRRAVGLPLPDPAPT
ncbi:aromatic ring-hydroxylating oxygenase subunit alpha [Paraliomyxa miuraensis]|uniref:aromatic ring-hydroxylating oxygenase subunit alpha n=1 Tax=Paraliomyxa miuraensis TaxID=376150 RepID=UPI0022558E22|nr:aromatic ring-hydroxylating dioxygenase subunit alpha [Paraliomyxa miuraensis]MCX4245574.1 aromatic ring-hydroxylating dioxygenase subunit alpha [Paraliomyxa miuraensis]